MTPTWIRRLFARCPSPPTRRPAKRRLSLEALEGRLVPTSSTVSLLSAAADGSAGGATSLPGNTSPLVSQDGRYVVFQSAATDLVAGQSDANSTYDVFLRDLQTGTTTLVSRAAGSSTQTANGQSVDGSISADGRYVTYRSVASNLVSGQTDLTNYDVFLFDRQTGSTTLVSHTPASSTTASNGFSSAQRISADGNFVVYTSTSTNILPNQAAIDLNSGSDVFLYDRANDTTYLVSVSTTGTTGSGSSDQPTLSADGRYVAFRSSSTNLASGVTDTNGNTDVFLYDRLTGSRTLISRNGGNPMSAALGQSQTPVVSADGNYVAFVSYANNLVPGESDTNLSTDVFLYSRGTGDVALVSHVAGDPLTAGESFADQVSISADGRYVAYVSASTDVVAGQIDNNFDSDVFVYDSQGGESRLVSHFYGAATTAADAFSSTPTISLDGRYVAYVSVADDLVSGQDDANGNYDVFLYDSQTGLNVLLSHVDGDDLVSSSMGASQAQISGDGSVVIFASSSPDLVSGDDNSATDLFAGSAGSPNTAPTASIDTIGAVRQEGTGIAVSGSGSDAEQTAVTLGLSWAVYKNGSATAFATGTGAGWSFTPDDDGSYRIALTVTDDGGLTASAEQTIAVSNAAPTPSIVSVGAVRVEGTSIAVSGTATDPAGANDTLSYAWQVFKDGGVTPFATGTGASYSFTPDDDGSYRIVLTVSDEDGGSASAEQIIAVSNAAPTPSIVSVGAVRVEGTSIAVSGTATDPAGANDTLSYSWAVYQNGSATPFATGTGSGFSFTPDDDGSYRIVLTVSDDGGLTASAEQTIAVSNAAPTPSIVSVGAVRVEGTSIAVSGTATDPAGANDTLSYAWQVFKDGGVTPFATGTGSGFSFTPGDDGSYRIVLTVSDEDGGSNSAEQTIGVSNRSPLLVSLPGGTITEGAAYTFAVTSEDVPADGLTYALEGDVPAGAAIDPVTGVFTWTPTDAQGPGTYTFTVRVTDDGTPGLSDARSVTFDVAEANQPPTLTGVPARATLFEGQAYQFTALAADADLPATTLRFSLIGGPAGAAIDPVTGVFTWTPAADQGANSYSFAVRVSDGSAAADLAVELDVRDVKTAPVSGPTGVTVVAPGESGRPLVRVLDPLTGEERFTVTAYDPSFTGGVRVASGDVNHDGVLDLVTAPGVGGAAHVRVFDGATGAAAASFFAYARDFTGGAYVAAGDLDGDGVAEIVTGAGVGGAPHVKVFRMDGTELASFFAYDPTVRGGVTVAVADVDGDGRAEIVTGPGPGGGPHVKVFRADGAAAGGFLAYAPEFRGGVFVAAGDLDGDGAAEIITGAGAGGGAHVRVFDGRTRAERFGFAAGASGFAGGVRVGLTRVAPDGRAAIVTTLGPGDRPQVRIWSGADGSELTGFLAEDPGFAGGIYVAG